jgi:peptide/nickel transport system permease protein
VSVLAEAALPPGRLAWRRFRGQALAPASALVLGLLLALALAAPLIGALLGHDPDRVDLLARLEPPSADHPLGTDQLGRDLLLRLLAGGRVSLAVGFAAALGASLVGTVIGLAAGYFGGRTDAALMRLTDGVIALPLLPLAIVLAAVDLTKLPLPAAWTEPAVAGFVRILAITVLLAWTTVARLVRGAALTMKRRTFVLAAEALGAGRLRIMVRHVLPSVAGPIIVATTLAAGNVILLESVLSFLGLGIAPPAASWGSMLTQAQELVWSTPRLAVWPGLMIFTTVIAINLLGDGLAAALDPRAGGRRVAQ